MPAQSLGDPAVKQMADDLSVMRRQQSINFYAPGIGVLILIALAYWILHV